MEGKVTFAEGLAALAAALVKADKALTIEQFEAYEEDRAEIACERCAYWPCVCGDPEFETELSQELNRAQEVD